MLPRIAIPHPTSSDLAYNRLNMPAFAQVIQEAGGTAVFLDLAEREAVWRAQARECHGVLLPGSPADVDPATYGQAGDPATAAPDHRREAMDRMLLEEAFQDGKPLLTVCFGTQMLNVLMGGTLIQDLTVLPIHHAASRAVAVAHTVSIAPGSLLAEVLRTDEAQARPDGTSLLAVNSSHHQAIGIVGSGLRVVARSPQDQVVEAIEMATRSAHFVLGVQWHPERTTAISATSRRLFSRLVAAAVAQ